MMEDSLAKTPQTELALFYQEVAMVAYKHSVSIHQLSGGFCLIDPLTQPSSTGPLLLSDVAEYVQLWSLDVCQSVRVFGSGWLTKRRRGRRWRDFPLHQQSFGPFGTLAATLPFTPRMQRAC